MPNPSANRSMFRRILRRLLFANRGRLFVILLALSAGAAVSAALLNLQVDAKRRLRAEFRSFGPNVVITPRETSSDAGLLIESYFDKISERNDAGEVSKAAFLYGVVKVSNPANSSGEINAVLVGYSSWYAHPERVISPAPVKYDDRPSLPRPDRHRAVRRHLHSW